MRPRPRDAKPRPARAFPWQRAMVWAAFGLLMVPLLTAPGSPMRRFLAEVFRKGDAGPRDQDAIDTRLAPAAPSHVVIAPSDRPATPDATATEATTALESTGEPTALDAGYRDRDRLGVSAEDMAAVKDSTPLSRPQERGVFFRVLGAVRNHTQADLTQRLNTREGGRDLSFAQLFRQPDFYRGKLVRVHGVARAAFVTRTPVRVLVNDAGEPINEAGQSVVGDGDPSNDRGVLVNENNVPVTKDDDPSNDDGVPANEQGIKEYYELWVSMSNNQNVVKVAALELPPNFPVSKVAADGTYGQIEEPIEIVGVFYKLLLYNDALQDVRSAPLLVTHTPIWRPVHSASKEPLPSPTGFLAITIATAVVAFAAAGILYYLAGAKARAAAALREAQIRPEDVQRLNQLDVTPPEVHTDLQKIAEQTPEVEPAWKHMQDAADEPTGRR